MTPLQSPDEPQKGQAPLPNSDQVHTQTTFGLQDSTQKNLINYMNNQHFQSWIKEYRVVVDQMLLRNQCNQHLFSRPRSKHLARNCEKVQKLLP